MPGLRRFVGLVVCAALVVLAGYLAFVATAGAPTVDAWTVAVVFVAAAAFSRTELRVWRADSDKSFALDEAGVVIALAVLSPAVAFPVLVSAFLAAEITPRRHPVKILYNSSSDVIGIAAACLLTAALRGGATSPRAVLAAAALGVCGFVLVNWSLMRRLTGILSGRPSGGLLSVGAALHASLVFGGVAVGLVFAALWQFDPWLAPIAVLPIIALRIAYAGSVHEHAVLAQVLSERDTLDRIVAGSSDGIILVDGEGIVQLWNPAMARLVGLGSNTARGRRLDLVLELLDDTGVPLRFNPFADDLGEDGAIRERDVLLPRRDGSSRPVRLRGTVLLDRYSRMTGAVVVLQDVSENRELMSLQKDFVGRVSHELRTPLTGIRGATELLRSRWGQLGDDDRLGLVDVVKRQTENLSEVVTALLSTSQIEHAGFRPTPDNALVADIVAAAVGAAVPLDGGITRAPIDTDVDDGLAVWVDAGHVRQALVNLLTNAIRYGKSRVAVSADRTDEGVAIHVTDAGPGVPAEFTDRLFEPFTQASTGVRRQSNGLGLGLHVARALVVANGGDLHYEANEPTGARFTIVLPPAATSTPPAEARRGADPIPVALATPRA